MLLKQEPLTKPSKAVQPSQYNNRRDLKGERLITLRLAYPSAYFTAE
jgi:hypothetical protein